MRSKRTQSHSRSRRLRIAFNKTGHRESALDVLQNARVNSEFEWRQSGESSSDAEEGVYKLALSHHVTLGQPADLPFADHMHCLVTIDVLHAPSDDRKPRLATIRFFMNLWSCSMMLFK